MGTQVIEKAIVLTIPPTLLGPESEYDKRRLALKGEYSAVLVEAQKLTEINTAEDAEKANSLGRILQAATKDAEIFFKPIKQQVDAFKAPILNHEKEFATPIDTEKKRLGGLLTNWNEKLRREREEEERKAREEAEKAAREEQLARAVELEASGDVQAAEAVLEEPVMAPVVIQSQAPPKVAGQVEKMNYSATVTNINDLLTAVYQGRAPRACLIADESYLNSKARLEKEGFSVPGVRLNKTPATHFRS
jgi:hypothetical protein